MGNTSGFFGKPFLPRELEKRSQCRKNKIIMGTYDEAENLV